MTMTMMMTISARHRETVGGLIFARPCCAQHQHKGHIYSTTAYLVVLILEFDTAIVHRVKDDSHGLDDIVEYYGLPFKLLALAEALRVYQPHLLKDRRLARFSGTCVSADMVSILRGILGGIPLLINYL